jgi:hypothetical protein
MTRITLGCAAQRIRSVMLYIESDWPRFSLNLTAIVIAFTCQLIRNIDFCNHAMSPLVSSRLPRSRTGGCKITTSAMLQAGQWTVVMRYNRRGSYSTWKRDGRPSTGTFALSKTSASAWLSLQGNPRYACPQRDFKISGRSSKPFALSSTIAISSKRRTKCSSAWPAVSLGNCQSCSVIASFHDRAY